MHHGSGGCRGCLWPPASFPSSQAKSRACYQEQKMCHLCCISFPFLHLFPARCASEITALGAEAGERGRQRPRQPYHCLAGRKEIRKFAEIFGQQNKHFSCQKPNGQPGQPAAICTARWLQPSGARCPPSPAAAPPYPGALSLCARAWHVPTLGTGTPVWFPPMVSRHNGCSTHSALKPCPCAVPAVPLTRGQVPAVGRGLRPEHGAGGAGWGCEGKRGTGPALFTPVTQPAPLSCPRRAQAQQSPRAPQSCHGPSASVPRDAPAQGWRMLRAHGASALQMISSTWRA